MHLQSTLHEIDEELNGFKTISFSEYKTKVKQAVVSTYISHWSSEIERLEGSKEVCGHADDEGWVIGYNHALSDQIQVLQEYITSAKKLIK